MTLSVSPRIARSFITAVLYFFIAGVAHAASVLKSPNDQRDYLAFTLPNELRVIVVSDPETDKAAAAIDVAVGSGNDPREHLGMAHFLEHMLFLGTEKYPEAGEYQKFIAEHGGQHNAYTTFEHTNYFFDVDARFLEPALDRFSQQFVAPLFNEKYVNRERNAVHSEFTSKIKDDMRGSHSAFRAILNQEHPYSLFSVGNLTTLRNTEAAPLREALVRFYEANYSANIMTLTIYGKEPVSQLKEWVEEKFAGVKNRHLKPKQHTQPLLAEQGPHLLSIKPNMDRRSLQVSFVVDSQEALYQQKPAYYVSNLLGHEGKGSLLSVLKEKGWTNSLSAGMGLDTGHSAMFVISMELTPEGLENWQEIVRLTLGNVEKVKNEGMQSFYFDEQKRMLDLSFEFLTKSSALHYASRIANEMHYRPDQDVLRGGYLLESYSPALYTALLNQLTPENALITLTAQNVETDSVSEWYETPFSYKPLPKEQVQPAPEHVAQFTLPTPNDFIPQAVAITRSATMPHPKILESSPGFQSWFAVDTEFNTPHSAYYINIRSPYANDSALSAVNTYLLVDLLKDELNEFSYPAYLGGLTFKIYGHIRGITIRIEGYPEKQSVLLSRILSTLTTMPIRKDRLAISLENLKRGLENASKKKPFEQTILETRRLMTSPLWSEEEKLAVIPQVNAEALNQFTQKLFSELEVVTMTHGNTTRAAALSLNQLVKSYLTSQATAVDVPSGRVALLGLDEQAIRTLDIDHPDSSYVMLIQGRNTSWEEKAYFALASQIASPEYYREMRTEKQLGYVVFVMPFSMFEVPGMGFIVQSPKVTPGFIHRDTEDFLSRFISLVAAMDDATWEKNKEAIISNLLKKETRLLERSDRFWTEIDRGFEQFNSDTIMAEAIQSASREGFMAFIQAVLDRSGKKLITLNQGNAEAIVEAAKSETALTGWQAVESKAGLWEGKESVQAE